MGIKQSKNSSNFKNGKPYKKSDVTKIVLYILFIAQL